MTQVLDVDFGPPPAYSVLRGSQAAWLEVLDGDMRTHNRILCVAPGGLGKTEIFGALCERFALRGQRALVLATRERLVEQTARRIAHRTGLQVDIEMAGSVASPYAPIVVACVPSIGKVSRLTGFSDDHFGVVIPDEAHLSLSPLCLRVMNYFHYGAESLADGWQPPPDGHYTPKARVCGFTATPELGGNRSLAEYYQPVERNGMKGWSVSYSYMEAVRDGWLVQPLQKSIPVKIDMRKYRAGSTTHGTDFKDADVAAAIAPVIEELADQCVEHASDRKGMAFLPSVECAEKMADALRRRGLVAYAVSGDSDTKVEDTDLFRDAGPGTWLCNAQIYNFGIDFPDVDCIGWFRATLSKAFYIQGVYRGSRVLPGIIDGLATADERRAAIAASSKRDMLILDPLFVHERIDLCDAYDLFTDKPEVKERMKAAGAPSPENAEEATRDFLKALNKAAKKAERKQARVINPLEWAVALGDAKLASWEPQAAWESSKPTPGQLDFLRRHHIDVSKIQFKGLAQKVIGIVLTRHKLGLATVGQLDFMHKLGIDDQRAATLSAKDATALIDATIAAKRA